MSKKLIFVSCGQLTDGEKTLGTLLKSVIDETPGFEAYFAQTVHDLDALAKHVFDSLRRCAGAVVILQDRGVVLGTDGVKWGHRSSVWVNQEIAILAYRQFFEARKIPVISFADPEVRLEGAMTSLIINARPLRSAHDVASQVQAWLGEGRFSAPTEDAFLQKWAELTDNDRKILAALLEEGGHDVKETAIRRAAIRLFGMNPNQAAAALTDAKAKFMTNDLVKLIDNRHSGDELSVHPTWEFDLCRQIAGWRERLLFFF